MKKRKLYPLKKHEKRVFEDVNGNNSVFLSEVKSTGPSVFNNEFAIVTTGIENKELAVSIISKSDIPRMIRQLTKLM